MNCHRLADFRRDCFSYNLGLSLTSENKILVRTPVLDARQNIIGYKLAWQNCFDDSGASHGNDPVQLIECIAPCVNHSTSGLLFIEGNAASLVTPAMQMLSPAHTVIMLDREELLELADLPLLPQLRKSGFGFGIRNADLAFLKANRALLRFVGYVEVQADQPDLGLTALFGRNTAPPLVIVVNHLDSWPQVIKNGDMGMYGFFSKLCVSSRLDGVSKPLSAQAGLILQLMQMVQENADVRQLEAALKRDAALSFKLFKYISSAGFGMRVEIQSLRHAVTMMGYMPLFRWLSTMLAISSPTGFSSALLQAAMVRGRFGELLGHGSLTKNEAENMFFVGMFSLLDQLLGIPMHEVLAQISLPQPVQEALNSHHAVFTPFLALITACEQDEADATVLADNLNLTPSQVNQAHMAAIAWAQDHQQ